MPQLDKRATLPQLQRKLKSKYFKHDHFSTVSHVLTTNSMER